MQIFDFYTNHFSVRNPGFKEDGEDYTYEEFEKIWGRWPTDDFFRTSTREN